MMCPFTALPCLSKLLSGLEISNVHRFGLKVFRTHSLCMLPSVNRRDGSAHLSQSEHRLSIAQLLYKQNLTMPSLKCCNAFRSLHRKAADDLSLCAVNLSKTSASS